MDSWILIKSVAQAIPMYVMQCFNIPKCILLEIDKLCRNFFWNQKGEEKKMAWIAWDKVVRGKKEGGIGLRDMQSFNKALLGKQAWRILKGGSSLMCKVLKGKYFPSCSFLEAKVPHKASYTWRSILSAREVLKKGAHKIIGNGAATDIWKDLWVPSLPKFQITRRPRLDDDMPTMVSTLCTDGFWNVNLISNLFTAEKTNEILKIPLPRFYTDDVWTWKFTKDGEYSVKSAYHVALKTKLENMPSSSSSENAKDWDCLWLSDVPPKVKIFGWKAMHRGIAVNSKLARRGIIDDDICQMCGNAAESTFHLLVNCEETKCLWRYSPFRLEILTDECHSFKEWVSILRGCYKEKEWWSIFWCLVWGLWKKRNAWIFQKQRYENVDLIRKALSLVEEYRCTNERNNYAKPEMMLPHKWHPPPPGLCKLNSDAVKFKGMEMGLGVVVRDHVGDVVVTVCKKEKGDYPVEVMEAMTLRLGLQTTIKAGFHKIILEVDNLKLFQHLRKGAAESSYFGCIVKDILFMANLCSVISFSFVKRDGNRVAHHLARLSIKYEELRVWLEEYPDVISEYVSDDMAAMPT